MAFCRRGREGRIRFGEEGFPVADSRPVRRVRKSVYNFFRNIGSQRIRRIIPGRKATGRQEGERYFALQIARAEGMLQMLSYCA